jgi:hypothetical protein
MRTEIQVSRHCQVVWERWCIYIWILSLCSVVLWIWKPLQSFSLLYILWYYMWSSYGFLIEQKNMLA